MSEKTTTTTTKTNKQSSTALRCGFFEKHIQNKYLCRPDKNYHYFCEFNFPVISLIVGCRNMTEVSKNMRS